jgi:Peptidase family M41
MAPRVQIDVGEHPSGALLLRLVSRQDDAGSPRVRREQIGRNDEQRATGRRDQTRRHASGQDAPHEGSATPADHKQIQVVREHKRPRDARRPAPALARCCATCSAASADRLPSYPIPIAFQSQGQALGYTISLPAEDKFLTTKAELTDTMAMTLGGRAAEEIVFGEITTGASNDLEKVTATAKQMVMRFGMSEKLGPRVFGHDHGMPFLGREFSAEPDYSDEIAREIDDEIRRIVEGAHQQAKDILSERRESLKTISEILLKRETIEREQFEALLEGKAEEDIFGDARVPSLHSREPRRLDMPAT